jgi:hypothetical protein
MRTCLLLAALMVGLGGLAGCSDTKTTAIKSDPVPGASTTGKAGGRIPAPVPPK